MESASVTWYAATLSALAPDVLMLPVNGRDHMRESAGIVGSMNEAEAAWLCAQVGPSHVIPCTTTPSRATPVTLVTSPSWSTGPAPPPPS